MTKISMILQITVAHDLCKSSLALQIIMTFANTPLRYNHHDFSSSSLHFNSID
jgi:hypothetical protein